MVWPGKGSKPNTVLPIHRILSLGVKVA